MSENGKIMFEVKARESTRIREHQNQRAPESESTRIREYQNQRVPESESTRIREYQNQRVPESENIGTMLLAIRRQHLVANLVPAVRSGLLSGCNYAPIYDCLQGIH